jgi:hypothetical protein
MDEVTLSQLRRKRDYYENDAPDWVKNIWPRFASFDWAIKLNRHELAAAGALVKLGRDSFIHTEKFPEVAREILGNSVARRAS